MNVEVRNLFPTPVLRVSDFISQKQCSDIVSFFKEKGFKHDTILGNGVSTYTTSSNALSEITNKINGCQNIAKSLNETVSNYVRVLGIGDIKVTNSWVNFQNKDSVLTEHAHPSSVISGALFLKSDADSNCLFFRNCNPFWNMTKFDPNNSTEFSYEHFWFAPVEGSLVLFPSWLLHGSNSEKNGSDQRVVFSFNTEYK